MNASQIYVAIAIVILAVIAGLVYFASRRKEKRLTSLASLAFAFVLAGLFFGQERWLGYGLLGIGVSLAGVDMVRKGKPSDSSTR
jgi:hypothetical protein